MRARAQRTHVRTHARACSSWPSMDSEDNVGGAGLSGRTYAYGSASRDAGSVSPGRAGRTVDGKRKTGRELRTQRGEGELTRTPEAGFIAPRGSACVHARACAWAVMS